MSTGVVTRCCQEAWQQGNVSQPVRNERGSRAQRILGSRDRLEAKAATQAAKRLRRQQNTTTNETGQQTGAGNARPTAEQLQYQLVEYEGSMQGPFRWRRRIWHYLQGRGYAQQGKRRKILAATVQSLSGPCGQIHQCRDHTVLAAMMQAHADPCALKNHIKPTRRGMVPEQQCTGICVQTYYLLQTSGQGKDTKST